MSIGVSTAGGRGTSAGRATPRPTRIHTSQQAVRAARQAEHKGSRLFHRWSRLTFSLYPAQLPPPPHPLPPTQSHRGEGGGGGEMKIMLW